MSGYWRRGRGKACVKNKSWNLQDGCDSKYSYVLAFLVAGVCSLFFIFVVICGVLGCGWSKPTASVA